MKRLHLTGLGALSREMVDAALPHECAAPALCYWCLRERQALEELERRQPTKPK